MGWFHQNHCTNQSKAKRSHDHHTTQSRATTQPTPTTNKARQAKKDAPRGLRAEGRGGEAGLQRAHGALPRQARQLALGLVKVVVDLLGIG